MDLVRSKVSKEMQTKIDKWDRIKLKNTCTENETINKKKKKKPSEWEKATDKGLTSKIYKQFMQLNIRQTNKPIKTWAEDLNR